MDASHLAVADIGNSRIKLAHVGGEGEIGDFATLEIAKQAEWKHLLRANGFAESGMRWAISSVNPGAATALGRLIDSHRPESIQWFRSAGDVPVAHRLSHPESTGADRALAVVGALRLLNVGEPGIVVSCGTALTVELIDADHVWLGGAITAGLLVISRSLASQTAQLPEVVPTHEVPPLGTETQSAIRGGVYWSLVGAVRELIQQQSTLCGQAKPRIVWTGGDAALIAPAIEGARAHIDDALVLRGLARVRVDSIHVDRADQ